MDAKREFEGKDLEEALQVASTTLGIAEPELDYEIVEQGRRGLFGLGAKSVRIRVMPPVEPLAPHAPQRPERQERQERERPERKERRDRPAKPGRQNRGERPQRKKRARRGGGRRSGRPLQEVKPLTAEQQPVLETVEKMVELMGLEVRVSGGDAGGEVNLVLEGKDQKLLTRRDGELISAFQFLLGRMARRAWPDVGRINVGTEHRAQERDDDLVELVNEVIQQVSSTGKAKRLHPMNAYERRLVHITVRQSDGGLASRSEGGGHTKRVKIYKPE